MMQLKFRKCTNMYLLFSVYLTVAFIWSVNGETTVSPNASHPLNFDEVDENEKCSYTNGSHIIDLKPLSHSTVFNTEAGMFYVNLCGQTLPCKGDLCLMKNSTANDVTVNYGKIETKDLRPDNTLVMNFTNGDICASNNSKNYSSVIHFMCDRGAEIGEPSFRGSEDCQNFFEWKTVLMCEPTNLSNHTKCVFTDPRTGFKANLSSLSRSQETSYEIHHDDDLLNVTFSINMCKPENSFKSTYCSGAAACMKTDKNEIVSLGSLSNLQAASVGGHMTLTYRNGSRCDNSLKNYTTEIEVVCSKDGGSKYPRFQNLTDCTAKFIWPSVEACNLQIDAHKCTLLTNDKYYDLRSLSSITNHWEVINNRTNETFYLNICHRLPKTVQTSIHGGRSAVCRVNDITKECEDNLGNVDDQVLHEVNNNLVVTYNGDLCNGTYTTSITLICKNRHEKPILSNFTNCSSSFEWETYEACPVSHKPSLKLKLPEHNGLFYDSNYDKTFNLSAAFNKTYNVTATSPETYNYIINLFNIALGTKHCINASVCQTKPDGFTRELGSLRNYQVMQVAGSIVLEVYQSNHQKCGKDSRKNVTTVIRLECSSDGEDHAPVFEYESNQCGYYFLWELAGACHYGALNGNQLPSATVSTSTALPPISTESTPSNTAEPVHKGKPTFAILLAFLLVMVCVSLIVYVFTSEERRSNVLFRFRRQFGPRTSPSFHYSQQINEDGL